jgi:protein-arginine kinase activator protein McsA
MKCQKCDKPATFHITELEKGKHQQELHLCEEHARLYLTQSEPEPGNAPTLAGALAQQLAVGQTAEELEKLDKKACPVCGITFYEFRNQGRLGCPHDYIFFEKELEPLIANIHGETSLRRRHAAQNRVDPPPPRNEGSDQRRKLRTGQPPARRNPPRRRDHPAILAKPFRRIVDLNILWI